MTSVMTAIGEGLAESVDASLSKTAPWTTRSPSNLRIGDRLQLIRKSHGISEKELSERLGIDCKDLNLYESGRRRVSASLLLRISKLLDIRPEYFFQDCKKREARGF
jgi:ribosome-binding protein aMBF1 (putative translation factor)